MTKKYKLTEHGKSKLETPDQVVKRHIMHIIFLQNESDVVMISRITNVKKSRIQHLIDELVKEGILQ